MRLHVGKLKACPCTYISIFLRFSMNFLRKVVSCLLVSSLIVGCASGPLRESYYIDGSKRAAFANLCQKHGMVSNEDFGLYASFQMGEYPEQFGNVEKFKMESMYLSEVRGIERWGEPNESDKSLLRVRCGEVSKVANNLRRSSSTPAPSIPFFRPPVHTSCYKIGTMTQCSTY